MQQTINIKPLSVNRAWQGKRFKTNDYKKYEKHLFFSLKNSKFEYEKLEINYKFGFSSKLSDLDNPVKLVQDILCKKYNFDDRNIYKITVEKEIVKKGKEYIKIEIKEWI